MNPQLIWKQPLPPVPDFEIAINAEGGQVGHINYITDRWIACYMGQRTLHLNQADAKAWVEQRAAENPLASIEQPEEPEQSHGLWTTGMLILAALALVVLSTGCAAAPQEPLPHYPCWDKKTQKYYECSDQEWLTQIILKERP